MVELEGGRRRQRGRDACTDVEEERERKPIRISRVAFSFEGVRRDTEGRLNGAELRRLSAPITSSPTQLAEKPTLTDTTTAQPGQPISERVVLYEMLKRGDNW